MSSNHEISQAILETGGATVGLLAGGRRDLLGPRDGDVYCVGGAMDGRGHNIPELHLPVATLDDDTIDIAISYVEDHVKGTPGYWAAAGFWHEPGTEIIVVDAIDAIEGRELALSVARERGERAIFHLLTGETIEVR